MKHFIVFCFFFFLCFNTAEAQTYANIPGPENVLVVYKMPSDTTDSLGFVSEAIKNYYVNARSIPASNIVPLPLPDSIDITIDDITHWVGIREEGDYIRDLYNHSISTWYATEHAWKYFLNNIV